MAIQQTYQIIGNRQRIKYSLAVCLIGLIMATVILDYWFTQFQNTPFYIFESVLFSSFWILFLPLLLVFSKLIKSKEETGSRLILTGIIIVIHLLVYPAFVWILSKTLYYHTFSYLQTFNFGLSAYFIKSVIIYSFFLLVFTASKNKPKEQSTVLEEKIEKPSFITSIVISERNNKKAILEVNNIYYFSANPPYINIHLYSKKHLHSETLKCLEKKLDNDQFVRIHKSHIINISKIFSFQSRKNGDYDVTLSDNSVLRLSRSYVKVFKAKLEKHNRVTAK
ncbi:MAG: LytTR family transcriptional regulator [Flavobacterium sp. JAD_PAG50586_2]|nr:MAG: LytTR family transcriptional regulator [Flavobacterium sp. JAD_PAG50586_2]